jgi:cytochrome c oxidase subunit 2
MLAGILITLLSLWYGQNHGLMPVAASDEANLVDGLFNSMMTVSFGLFLIVEGALIISAIKFRRKPDDETDGPHIEGNIPLEIVWTAIPAVIVLLISVYSFDIYGQMGGFDPDAAGDDGGVTQVAMLPGEETASPLMSAPAHQGHHHSLMAAGVGASPGVLGRAPDVTVDVMGLQYAWIFTYPETGVISGELHVPVNQDVRLNIKAQDVLHAFWLPEFRLKQDAIPGRDTEIRFSPKRPGDYPIVCAELCGAYHGSMVSRIYVHPEEEYETWMSQQVALQAASPETLATRLQNQVLALTTLPAPEDYLAPYAQEVGLTATTLEALHPSE